ncbi:hypothetical protein FEM03_08665 [Phragmitibacter flavus]|uniref:Verru_Chthon cassette protein A n=1 Tax=Phragmitibacter flavus TaxID=2576071 RepID=A0A5R8KFB8_9BACT|nr:pilus assembly PilX N-terminal domain-containing protein [Phragmitibacter flavus]TLD70982.1 hypothetical protein FEM03_08665 [Phragmitibacter flavus]
MNVDLTRQSRSRRAKAPGGFSLVLTLMILAAVTIVVVSLFTTTVSERASATSHEAVERAELALQAGLTQISGLLTDITRDDQFLILQKDTGTDANGRTKTLLMGARPNADYSAWTYTPLSSGYRHLEVLGTPVVKTLDFSPKSNATSASDTLRVLPWQAQPDVYWETYDDSATNALGETRSAPHTSSRFAFWIEDLQGLLNLEAAGNNNDITSGAEPRHQRTPISAATDNLPVVPGLNLTNLNQPLLNQSALYTLIDPAASEDSGGIDFDNWLISRRNALISPGMWKQIVLDEGFNSDSLKRLPTGLFPEDETYKNAANLIEANTITGVRPYEEQPLIPGYPVDHGFAGQGSLKLNLNQVLADLKSGTLTSEVAVITIAQHIRTHLPKFEERAGGFPFPEGGNTEEKRFGYLKALAASIIDYADEDSQSTIKEGEYRGVDSFPLVNEQWQQFRVERDEMFEGNLIIYFTYYTHLELWNQTNKTVRGKVKAALKAGIVVGGRGSIDLHDSLDEVTDIEKPERDPDDNLVWLPETDIELQPNQFKLISIPVNYKFNVGLGARGDNIECLEDRNSRYYLKFQEEGTTGFTLIDRPGGFLERNERNIHYSGASGTAVRQAFNTTSPGMSYGLSTNSNDYRNNVSDPRSAFYITSIQSLVNYERGSSPGGRNLRRSSGSGTPLMKGVIHGEQLISKWPDGGHDVEPAHSTNPYTTSKAPHEEAKWEPFKSTNNHPPTESAKASQLISNSGKYFSVTELGNIFDPHMWDPDGGSETSTVTWQNFVDIGSIATPSSSYCGGNTLRIGRPEHTRWRPDFRATPDPARQKDRRHSASALLDVFHVGVPTSTDQNVLTGDLVTTLPGQVNINTATKDTLRAIFAGPVKMDSVALPPNLKPPTQTNQADLLAQAVIDCRPYLSNAESAEKVQLLTNGQFTDRPWFGSKDDTLTGNSIVEVNDPALEEFFARLYNNGTVRSRNFRILLTGQALRHTPSGDVMVEATRSRLYHVFIKPERAADGSIVRQQIQITYARNL